MIPMPYMLHVEQSAAAIQYGQQVAYEAAKVPIPEFSGIAVVAFSALAVSLYLLRRRRK